MSEYYLGEVRMFGGNFAPSQWAFCNGQLLAISQYSALFSLLGTTFGGNGTTNFALPNLQGRLPIGQGQGTGLTNRVLGEVGGSENVLLTTSTIPLHSHTLNATQTAANAVVIGNTVVPAKITVTNGHFYTNAAGTSAPTYGMLQPQSCGFAGNSLPHPNLMPALCVTFIIALAGIFPSRN